MHKQFLTNTLFCMAVCGTLQATAPVAPAVSSRMPQASARQPARGSLYNPQQPSCLEWDAHKNGLERFLADTSEPVAQMDATLQQQRQDYQRRTGKILLQQPETDWPQDYTQLHQGVDSLMDMRNASRSELKKMVRTENDAAIISRAFSGNLAVSYCREAERT